MGWKSASANVSVGSFAVLIRLEEDAQDLARVRIRDFREAIAASIWRLSKSANVNGKAEVPSCWKIRREGESSGLGKTSINCVHAEEPTEKLVTAPMSDGFRHMASRSAK